MARDYSQKDEQILRAIESFEGVPGSQPLSTVLHFSKTFIFTRIRANRRLRSAVDKRGREYIRALTDDKLAQKVAAKGWVSGLSSSHQKLVYSRVDLQLLRTIQSFDDVPTAERLNQVLSYNDGLISKRIKARRVVRGTTLKQAIDQRGEDYIRALSEERFAEKIRVNKWVSNLSKKHKKLVYQRADARIFQAVQSFDGVPSVIALSFLIGYSRTFISERLKVNRELQQAIDKRGEEYIKALSDDELADKIETKGWISGLSEAHQKLVYQRADARIFQAVQSFDGVPSGTNLCKLLPYGHVFIYARIKANEELQKAIDQREEEHITGLNDEQLSKKIALKWWISSLSVKAQQIVYQRTDQQILKEIQSFTGIPSSRKLSNVLSYGKHFISQRISANPILWQAYYKKRGLTVDQALELALEREDKSLAAKQTLVERLENLHAFREVLGVIRCFQDLFTKAQRIVEVSLYPSPLTRAEEVLESRFNLFLYSNLRETRLADAVQDIDMVVIQGLHRHADINALLTQIKSIAQLNARIILTYSTDYSSVDAFQESLERAGFSVQEQGLIEMEAPSNDELLNAGVSDEDLSRVRAKVRGQSNVLVLTNERASDDINVPSLVKASNEGVGKPLVSNDAIEITTPREVLQTMQVKFIPELTSYPSEPLLVDVVDGKRPVAVIGFDMNQRRPRRLEVEFYPGAPANDDVRTFARRISRMRGPRRDYGIRPGQHGKVHLSRIR